jgi:hypothetical protein
MIKKALVTFDRVIGPVKIVDFDKPVMTDVTQRIGKPLTR